MRSQRENPEFVQLRHRMSRQLLVFLRSDSAVSRCVARRENSQKCLQHRKRSDAFARNGACGEPLRDRTFSFASRGRCKIRRTARLCACVTFVVIRHFVVCAREPALAPDNSSRSFDKQKRPRGRERSDLRRCIAVARAGGLSGQSPYHHVVARLHGAAPFGL